MLSTSKTFSISIEMGNYYTVQQKPNCLVVSSGGIKGISVCGALEELDRKELLSDIKTYIGCSAGSIICTLLALGYTVFELTTLMSVLNVEDLFDSNTSYLTQGLNLTSKYGEVEGIFIYSFIGKLIQDKFQNEDLTLKELYTQKGIKLRIAATCLSYKSLRMFNETDNIPIRLAIRMSTSIPYIFTPVLYNEIHGKFLHAELLDKTDAQLVYVDGGLLNTFPTEYIEAGEIALGLRIVTEKDLSVEKKTELVEIDSLKTYSFALLETMLSSRDKLNNCTVIDIITPNYPINKFCLTDLEKQELLDRGRKAIV